MTISMGIYEKNFFLVFQVYRKCEYISETSWYTIIDPSVETF